MKVLVIGASGQIGAWTVKDLVEFYDAEVIAADLSLERAKALAERMGKENITPIKLDAADPAALKKAAKGVDVIHNSAWYELNIKVMPVAIELGVHYSDLGGFYDYTLKQLEYDKKAKDAGVTCVLGIGSSPGITNVCGEAGARRLDSTETISIYCSWGTKVKTDNAAFPSYSVRTVLDEMTQEPGIVDKGKKKKVPVLSGMKEVVMPEPSGKVVAYYIKHSEPATMADFIGRGTKNVSFRIGFPANDFATFRTLAQLGFMSEEKITAGGASVSPKDFLTAMYLKSVESSRGAAQSVDEFDYFRVDVEGSKDGRPAMVTYYVKTWNDSVKGIPSARDTSVPPSITADWLFKGKITKRGTLPPEACIEPEPFFKELGRRKIMVDEELQYTKTFY
ncbi:MAG: saccharopine dehydrogenase NADP-binding domain-containing protein [Thermoplasmata archaeon]|nr:saccharopine dehydrogenase NADP-binding domain-containing protein [Thermoplasmata archaeon]